jgi:hypothetical protein
VDALRVELVAGADDGQLALVQLGGEVGLRGEAGSDGPYVGVDGGVDAGVALLGAVDVRRDLDKGQAKVRRGTVTVVR